MRMYEPLVEALKPSMQASDWRRCQTRTGALTGVRCRTRFKGIVGGVENRSLP